LPSEYKYILIRHIWNIPKELNIDSVSLTPSGYIMFAKWRVGQTDTDPADDTDPEKISGSDKKIIIYRSGKI
jgi:hypothetical protein